MVSVVECVGAREFALPDVAHVIAVWLQFVAPCVCGLVEAAASGVFPLGLGRQTCFRPIAVRDSVGPGDVCDWVVDAAIDVGIRAVRMPPIRAVDPPPPFGTLYDLRYLPFDFRGDEVFEDERPAETLGIRYVPGCGDEGVELGDGYEIWRDGEFVNGDIAYRAFAIGGEPAVIGAHLKFAAGQPHRCSVARPLGRRK